jgi:hypothetical protein
MLSIHAVQNINETELACEAHLQQHFLLKIKSLNQLGACHVLIHFWLNGSCASEWPASRISSALLLTGVVDNCTACTCPYAHSHQLAAYTCVPGGGVGAGHADARHGYVLHVRTWAISRFASRFALPLAFACNRRRLPPVRPCGGGGHALTSFPCCAGH